MCQKMFLLVASSFLNDAIVLYNAIYYFGTVRVLLEPSSKREPFFFLVNVSHFTYLDKFSNKFICITGLYCHSNTIALKESFCRSRWRICI